MAKVSVVITLTAVAANAPPQYTGPSEINDGVIGKAIALQGMDPDGDPITWSVDPADGNKVDVGAAGTMTPLIPLDKVAVTVWMDDGKA